MKKFNILILSILVLFVSCRKEFEKPRWDAGILAPLIKTSLGVEDLIKDSIVQKNPDNSLKIVNRELLYSMTLDSLLNLSKKNFPEYNTSRTLDELKLDSQSVTRRISLKQIAESIVASPTATPQQKLAAFVLLNSHGQTISKVDAVTGVGAGPVLLDANAFFKEADLKEGKMQVTVTNGLPLTITDVTFILQNQAQSVTYYEETFQNLTPNKKVSSITDLAGKKVEGTMAASVKNMNTAEANNVLVDTSAAIVINIKIYDVRVNSATAVFPAQNVIDDSNYVYLVSMGDAKLSQAKIRSGSVRVEVSSSAQDNIYFTYDIPGASDASGIPFKINDMVPPSQSGAPFVKDYDLAGYVLDLTGKNSKGQSRSDTTFNAFFNKITGRIEYTGRVVYLSLSDYMSVKISMENIVPEYVKGYLGKDSVLQTGTQAIDLFKKVTGGNLTFEQIDKIGVTIENGIGVPGFVKVNSITGTRPGQQSVSIKNITQTIEPATLSKDKTPVPIVKTSFVSLKDNGGLDLLNMMPHNINYNVEAYANNGVNEPYPINQFAYYGAPLNIFLDMELPLSIWANQLQLADTIEFLTKEIETTVKSGYLNLIANNGFPVSANLELYFLDANKQVVGSLTSPGIVAPAPVTAGKATGKTQTVVKYNLGSEETIQNILHSKYLVFKAEFDSQPQNQHYKIYSDYQLDVTVSGNVNVTIE